VRGEGDKGQVASDKGQVASDKGQVASDKGRGSMNSGSLHQFVAYQKALELFDLVVADVARYLGDRKLERLVSQQLASADSVCSNIEEGYGRESTVEYRRFLIIARGSLRETQGCYHRLRHWLRLDVVEQRIGLAEEINRILSATIKRLTGR
jgi:four helix bundle protein